MKITDKKRIDFLESLLGVYTGKVILRNSTCGRGFRLHETSFKDGSETVREAIDKVIKRGKL